MVNSVNSAFLANISAALGGEDGSSGFVTEAKKRGMSDVDDTNLRQLNDNASSSINL